MPNAPQDPYAKTTHTSHRPTATTVSASTCSIYAPAATSSIDTITHTTDHS